MALTNAAEELTVVGLWSDKYEQVHIVRHLGTDGCGER